MGICSTRDEPGMVVRGCGIIPITFQQTLFQKLLYNLSKVHPIVYKKLAATREE